MALPSEHGIGGSGGGSGEKFSVDIDIVSRFDSTGIDQATAAIKEIDTVEQNSAKTTENIKKNTDEYGDSLRKQIAPVRSISWDLILMGRSFSIINSTLLGSNQIVKDFTAAIYTVGAIIRVVVTAVDIMRVAHILGASAAAAHTTANYGLATSFAAVSAAAAPLLPILMIGAAIAGIATLAYLGFNKPGSVFQSPPSMQTGGFVSATGPYILHKGETVIPAGASTNIININMTTGGISSSVDVDRMLDSMSLRMLQESRRRLGSGI